MAQVSESAQEERALRLQVNNSSSGSAMASTARTMSFVLPSEVCFEIEDADQLTKYTEAEWAVIMEEWKLSQH